jgi:ribosome maturation factor RimP
MNERFAASDVAARAEQVLRPLIVEAGFELLLCDWTGVGGRPVLQVFIERPDGEAIGIGDCVAVHNAITDYLDVEDLIPVAYDLQVSSPGLERPMKRPEHFEAQLGQLARVRTWEPIQDRRNWKGTIERIDGDILSLAVDGREHRIPIPAIERATLVYEPAPKGQKKGGSRRKRGNR